MRIQKKFQGVVPENKILDVNSDSPTDTYSCRKINEMTKYSGVGGTPTDFTTKWVKATLTEDFNLYNANSYCRYSKVGNMVNIQFVLSPASADNVLNSATETTAFVLPEEYRPSQNLNVLCQGSGTNIFNVGVNVSGNVNIYRYRDSASYSSTPPSTSTWLPCNITYFVDSGEFVLVDVSNKKEYDITQYINPELDDVTVVRTRCVNKHDRVVMDFVIQLNLNANVNALLFTLPDELMPPQSVEFTPCGNEGDTKIYGIGWINKSNNAICVNLSSNITTAGYLRCCIVYDL